METYTELKERQEKEFNAFPMVFAFNDKQFREGMEKLGLTVSDTDKVYKNNYGGIYRRTDSELLKNILERHTDELTTAIYKDQDGTGFIFSMFNYELANHEYCYTWDITDTINALGLTIEEINKSEALTNGLRLAKQDQRDQD